MVLCSLLLENNYRFSIAHCNFKLREKDSDADESLVRSFAAEHNLDVFVQSFDTGEFARENKMSIQEAARKLRYDWFDELVRLHGFSCIATAHHADDSAETMLMNLFKGTGITGLHGILPKRGIIVRPLLFAKKKEIMQYAQQHQIQWNEDASNATEKYTRNFFRHNVIPLVEKVIPNATGNLLHTIGRMKETAVLYHQAIEAHRKRLLEYHDGEVHIPVLKLEKTKPLDAVAYEIIKDFGFTANQLTDLKALLKAETGKYISSPSHRITRNRKWLIISPVGAAAVSHIFIEPGESTVLFPGGSLQIKVTDQTVINKSTNVAMVDAAKISFPLMLRKWKAGDYFYPLGMPKKKKVARFLIDLKVPAPGKEKVWVIESDKKIIWLVGYRIDDRFKITASTKKVLRLQCG